MEQGTPQWHNFRRNHIGASDAPSIMGVSPYKTIFQLWEEKLNLWEQPDNFSMRRGRDMESSARERFEHMTGLVVAPCVIECKVWPVMAASLDGMTADKTAFVEIKCAGKKDHQSACNEDLPEKYFPQLQHQLAVTGLSMAYYFSFNGIDGKILKVHRDDAYIKSMIAKEKEFWRMVQELDYKSAKSA